MSSDAVHKAVIIEVGNGSVTVSAETDGGCEGCKVAMLCQQSGNRLLQRIKVDDPSAYHVGDEVAITATDPSRWRAMIFGFGLPCILLIFGVLGLLAAGVGTTWSIVITFAAIILYYIILALNRSAIESRLQWQITKLQQPTSQS